eukprot:PhM_4_TR10343/c0_g1_i4/m.23532
MTTESKKAPFGLIRVIRPPAESQPQYPTYDGSNNNNNSTSARPLSGFDSSYPLSSTTELSMPIPFDIEPMVPQGAAMPLTHNAGFVFKVFSFSWDQFVSVPSQMVLRTAGSERYIAEQRAGRRHQTHFHMCKNFATGLMCKKGATCPFIHAQYADVDLENGTVEASPVHLSMEVPSLDGALYPRHPAGFVLSVCEPNRLSSMRYLNSEYVYVTEGSKAFMAANFGPNASPSPSNAYIKHCAHFFLKKMCRMGHRCNFLHAVVCTSDSSTQSNTKTAVNTSNSKLERKRTIPTTAPTAACVPPPTLQYPNLQEQQQPMMGTSLVQCQPQQLYVPQQQQQPHQPHLEYSQQQPSNPPTVQYMSQLPMNNNFSTMSQPNMSTPYNASNTNNNSTHSNNNITSGAVGAPPPPPIDF